MRRLSGVAGVVLMACLSLSACYLGPSPIQYAALAVIDGRPTAVVASCGKGNFRVAVFRNGGPVGEYYSWAVVVTPPSPVREVEVELFGKARPGWEITAPREGATVSGGGPPKDVQLTSLEAGTPFILDSSTGGPEGSFAPPVRFTTDDLATIGAGQVLAPVDHEHGSIVSRESFVKERCG